MQDLASFTGPGYEQEDDITLLVVEREASPGGAAVNEPLQTLASSTFPASRATNARPPSR